MRFLLAAFLLIAVSLPAFADEKVTGANPLENAEREFQQGHNDRALALLPPDDKDPKVLDLRGRIFAQEDKTDEAVTAFDAAYSANPNGRARMHLGDLFLHQKKWADARGQYEASMKETNILINNERLRYGVLMTYLGAKDEENARAALDKITFPTETAAYYYAQAAWAFAHDKKREGEKWMQRGRDVVPAKDTDWFARPLYDLGWIKTKPGPFAE